MLRLLTFEKIGDLILINNTTSHSIFDSSVSGPKIFFYPRFVLHVEFPQIFVIMENKEFVLGIGEHSIVLLVAHEM